MRTPTTCLLGLAFCALGQPRSLAAPEVPLPAAFSARLEAALRGHLTPAERRRLLRDPRVRAELAWLAAGYDGKDDAVEVETTTGRLRIRVRTGTREIVCDRLDASSELPDPPLRCEEVVTGADDRRLELDAALWRKPRAPRQEPPAPAERTEDPTPLPTLLRRSDLLRPDPDASAYDPELTTALRAHAEFREAFRGQHWTDPFLTRTLSDELPELWEKRSAGRARREPDPAVSVLNGRSIHLQGLPLPFQIGPGEDPETPPNIPDGPSALDAPDATCLESWQARDAATRPPPLACFETVVRRARLERTDVYAVDQALGSVLGWWPGWRALMKLVVADASDEHLSAQIWALTWLEWVGAHPTQAGPALAKLRPRERRTLRRRLWGWWTQPAYAPYHAVITELYEAHLGALYPELQTPEGTPDLPRMADGYLWATNWLAAQRGVVPERIRERYQSLAPPARRLVQAVMKHPAQRRRYSDAVAAIADGV